MKPLPKLSRPLLVFAVALAVRLAVIGYWSFDGLYGQDAFAYLARSAALADSPVHGWAALPPFHWPDGFPLLAALAMQVAGGAGPQLLNVLLGSLLAAVVFFLSRDLRTAPDGEVTIGRDATAERVGLAAGLCTALAGQPVLSSVVVMSDTAAALWLALTAWLLLRFADTPQRWWWLPAAAGAGAAAVVTRWASALAVPALVAVALTALGRARRPALVAGVGLVAAMTVLVPPLLLVLPGAGFGAYFEGWHLLNAFAGSISGGEGGFLYRFPGFLFYAAPFWHPALLPPTLGVFAIPGAATLWRVRRTGLLLVAGWFGAAYLFLVGLPQQNLRFSVTLWTPAVILVAVGVVATWRRRPRTTAVLIAASLAIAVTCNLWWWNRFMGRAHEARVVAERVVSTLPEGGRVLAFDITLAVEHYTGAEVLELFNLDEEALAQASDDRKPTLLVVNRHEIEARWQDLPPHRNLAWLDEHRHLVVVEVIGPWSIERVNRGSGSDGGVN